MRPILIVFAIVLASHVAHADDAEDLKACNAGKAEPCETLATKTPAKAVTYLEKACTLKSARACNNLGVAWSEGKDGASAVDHDKARGYYERACSMSHGTGCFNLGNIYRLGEGLPVDLKRAHDLFQKACDLDDPKGCTELGILYYEGKLMKRDLDKTISLLEKGCRLGSQVACKNVGLLKKK